MGEVSGKTEDRVQRTENKISGNQGNRILGYQENGEFRICKLELRMDSVSKPALSKAEWVRNDKVVLKRDFIICEILLDGKVANLV